MSDARHPWSETLEGLHAQAWHRLVRGVHDRHAPARHPTLATVGLDGWPQARTVVLRKADRASARLEIHTHLGSAKVAQLQALPRAALHVWDNASRLQMRLQANVTVSSGPEVADTWTRVPDRSRTAYSQGQAPGSPLATALAYDTTPDAAMFTVLYLYVCTIDLLHLGSVHRRAQFSREGGWAGCWVVP